MFVLSNHNNYKMNCIVCNKISYKISHNLFFRHLDFKLINFSVHFYKCTNCQLIFNPSYLKILNLSKINSKFYIKSKQTEHKLYCKKEKLFATRSYFQVNLFYKKRILNNKINKILDFGCFDGLFLKEVEKFFKNIDLFGYDNNIHLKKIFKFNKNKLILKKKELFNHKFDLIFFSFSIFYVYNLHDLFNIILKNILNNNGKIVVHIPDIEKNNGYFLYGDQSFIPTKVNLINIFNFYGYKYRVIKSSIFNKDYIFVFTKIKNSKLFLLKENKTVKIIHNLKKLTLKLRSISSECLLVFGTTINAAFYDQILKNRNVSFVDENIDYSKREFRGKLVIHPKNLNTNSKIIVPRFKGSNILIKRLKNTYNGNFYLI